MIGCPSGTLSEGKSCKFAMLQGELLTSIGKWTHNHRESDTYIIIFLFVSSWMAFIVPLI